MADDLTLRSYGWSGLGQMRARQFLPISFDQAWDFFSNPANLNELTPPDLHFRILSPTPAMYSGQILLYRIRLAPLIWTTWVTEITECHRDETGAYFIDEQRQGPYVLWYHEHRFTPHDGGVVMEDIVTYRPPGFIFARPLRRVFIDRKLRKIFRYRQQTLAKRYAQ